MPLDIWCEPPKDSPYYWHCNNPNPIYTDKEFWEKWSELPGDDVVRLSRIWEKE